MKMLIVFYSRTGTTRKAAEWLAAKCNADLEAIHDARPRLGLLAGWWRSIKETRARSEAEILPDTLTPKGYDLIVLATPVWVRSISSPLRTWINRHRDELGEIAVFVTQGGRGGELALAEVAELVGKTPVASLILDASQVASSEFASAFEPFLDVLTERGFLGETVATASNVGRTAYWSEAHQGQLGW